MINEMYLYQITDMLRSDLNIKDYKFWILPILSLKYLEKDNRFPKEASLSEIIKNESDTSNRLQKAFDHVEQNFQELKGIYKVFPSQKVDQNLLFNFLLKVNSLNLTTEEWARSISSLLYNLYRAEGKRNGALYSPESINKLGIELLEPKSGTFYDGSPGIGGTLVQAYDYVKAHGGTLHMYGQEINYESWALAKFNLLFHDCLDNTELKLGDTLLDPAFIEDNGVTKFDYVMMNFPFSMAIRDYNRLMQNHLSRFVYGKPPKRSADMAFIMHGLSSLKSDGKAVFVVTNGTLFRGASEQTIRQNMIAADVIEAVIALPDGLYENTGIPTNLLVLNKNKPAERKGKILFINAENEYETVGRHKYMKTPHIEKIVKAYKEGLEIKKFSTFVSTNEIEDADLLCKRYLEENEIELESFGTVVMKKEKMGAYQSNNLPLCLLASEIYRGMNISSKSVKEGKGEYKVIKLSDVQDGEINLNDLANVSLLRNSKVSMYIVQEGDVIVSNRGASIKIAVIPKTEGNVILSHNFIGIRCGNRINPYFLKAYLESPLGQYLLNSKQIGTNILTINPKDLKDIKVPVLDMNEQVKIAEGFRNTVTKYREAIRQAEEEKKQSFLKLYEQMGIRSSFEIVE